MAAKKGSHWGSFAGGFGEALLRAMAMSMRMRHYQALEDHWRAMENRPRGGGPPPDVYQRGFRDAPVGGGKVSGSNPQNPANIKAALVRAGVPENDADTLTRVSGRENSWNLYGNNAGLNKDGTVDHGLFQVNDRAWPQLNPKSLDHADLDTQAKAAAYIYKHQGLGAWDPTGQGKAANALHGVPARYLKANLDAATPAAGTHAIKETTPEPGMDWRIPGSDEKIDRIPAEARPSWPPEGYKPPYADYPQTYPQTQPGTPRTTRGPGSDVTAPVVPETYHDRQLGALPPRPVPPASVPPSNTPARMAQLPMPVEWPPPYTDPNRSTTQDPRAIDRDVATMAEMPSHGGDPRDVDRNLARIAGMRPAPTVVPSPLTSDTPSADATPVSAIPPQPSVRGTGGVTFTGQSGGYSPTQSRQYNLPITMAQWGPNPPVTQQGNVPPSTAQHVPLDRTPMPPVRPPDATIATGAAKGGVIPSRPVTKFQWGGGAIAAMIPGNYQYNMNMGMADAYSQAGGSLGQAYAGQRPGTYPSWVPDQINADLNMQSYFLNEAQRYAQPAATPTPTPTPTATPTPAPVVQPTVTNTVTQPTTDATVTDPTLKTSTGAFNLPNLTTPTDTSDVLTDVGAKNYAQTQNTGGVNYGTDTSGNTTILSARGGLVRRYQDGGGVLGDVSPTVAGMPPGLSGGMMPPPPIYYNPATYSQAGAPIGKGITQNAAPTYVAGAIPTLPMARGGVVRFQEGGGVDAEMAQADMEDMYEGQQQAAEDAQTMRPQQVASADATGSEAIGPAADVIGYNFEQRPEGATPETPQITDNQGHPSRGIVGAIVDGLHNLGEPLGLGGGRQGAVANDPYTQTARRNFAQGNHPDGTPGLTDQDVQTLHASYDPNGELSFGMRQLYGMEAVRNWYMNKGDANGAAKTAALMMQKSVELSKRYGEQAWQMLHKGDMQGVADAMTKAKEMIADGTLMNATPNSDGTITINGMNLKGQKLWEQVLAPGELLGVVQKMRDGSGAWNLYELAAGKYASDYGDRVQRGKDIEYDRRAAEQEKVRSDLAEQASIRAEQRQEGREQRAKDEATADTAAVDAARARARGSVQPQGGVTPTPVGGQAPYRSPVLDQEPGRPLDSTAQAASFARPQGADGATQPALPGPTVQRGADEYGLSSADYALLRPEGQSAAYQDADARVLAQYPQPPETSVEGLSAKQATQARANDAEDLKRWQEQVGPMRQRAHDDVAARIAHANKLMEIAAGAAKQQEGDILTEQRAEKAPLGFKDMQELLKQNPSVQWIAATPFYTTNPNMKPEDALAAAANGFNIKGQGGMARLDAVSGAWYNTVQYNKHIDPGQVSELLTGWANGSYEPKLMSVDKQTNIGTIYIDRKDGTGETLKVPQSEGAVLNKVSKDMLASRQTPPTAGRSDIQSPPPLPASVFLRPSGPVPQGIMPSQTGTPALPGPPPNARPQPGLWDVLTHSGIISEDQPP